MPPIRTAAVVAAERDRLQTDLADLGERHGTDEAAWPAGVAQRATNLSRGIERLDGELIEMAQRAERLDVVRRAAGGAGNAESGDGATGFGQRVGAGPEVMRRTDPWADVEGIGQVSRARMLDGARAALERADDVPDAARTVVERALTGARTDVEDDVSAMARFTVVTSNPAYRSAFARWMRDPMSGHYDWSPAEREASRAVRDFARAMSIGTPGAGGFIAPFALDPQILISGVGSVDPMRRVARVELVASNDARFITSLGVTASWDAEAAEVSDDSPALLQPAITSFKGQAFVPVSFELFEDSNIAAQVGGLFADAKAQLESTAFTTGTGSGQPKGVITAVSAVGGSVVASAGSALAVADVTANQNALPARWRARARWMLNLSIINQGRVLPLYTNGPAAVSDATNPPRMLGWEVLENSAMDGTIAAGTTNDYCLLSGDFASGYIIVDRVGTMVEYVPHLFGANGRPTGQRGFLMHFRSGGDAVIPDAFRLTNYSA